MKSLRRQEVQFATNANIKNYANIHDFSEDERKYGLLHISAGFISQDPRTENGFKNRCLILAIVLGNSDIMLWNS